MRLSHTKRGVRISLISIIASIFLAGVKLLAGFVGKSSALISDGANSLSDIVSYTVVMGGLAASSRKADSSHQYGHEKLESLVSFLLALVILATGVSIGFRGFKALSSGQTLVVPSPVAFWAALLSVIVKIFLWRITVKGVKATKLNSLRALAGDHLSDIFSSTGALVGIAFSRLGWPMFDLIASIVIALLIIGSSFEVFRASYHVLMDASVDTKTRSELEKAILLNPNIKRIDLLRTRRSGNGCWVESEICCCGNLHLIEAHAIAEEVHDRIERDFPYVRHIMVHINPCFEDEEFCKECDKDPHLKHSRDDKDQGKTN
ncbi:MAG: cation diffusion facilitator family transporter [Sphaerochaetaceae bacterium]|nr:cation diffusion facilitator family transporter [Sphaerochaetaceae bacterium]HHU88464.1 cation transporter [Spirochaetales bacterium]